MLDSNIQFNKTQHKNNLNDYEEQGVAAIEVGLKRDKDILRNWFINETNFEHDFDIDKGAILLMDDDIFHGAEAINTICNEINQSLIHI